MNIQRIKYNLKDLDKENSENVIKAFFDLPEPGSDGLGFQRGKARTLDSGGPAGLRSDRLSDPHADSLSCVPLPGRLSSGDNVPAFNDPVGCSIQARGTGKPLIAGRSSGNRPGSGCFAGS